jgi:class 3 adenylate cyclase
VEATVDVAAWLKNLGLGQYDAAFRDNAVDAEVLPQLTGDDLKELGVTSVGHRRKLLAEIAALAPPLSSERTGQQPSPEPPKKDPELSAERRHLTVMFCDLMGSTTISAALDAEDWRNLVSAYLDAASEAVTQMGGHVAKKLGDGLMALFGYPRRALAELNNKNAGSGWLELVARIGVERGRWWWMRPEKSSATRPISPRACRRWPSRARSWSRLGCSVRWSACSSLRTAARMR